MHLFLTGEKGVGKSTLVASLCDAWGRPAGGFRTVRARNVLPERTSVHLLNVRSGEKPGRENLLFLPHRSTPEGTAAGFDRLGTAALEPDPDVRLILMDELGPNEGAAERFQRAVFRTLDGSVPVLGVLQQADSGFLGAIAARPDVRVVTVTAENRNRLARELPGLGKELFSHG